MTTTQREYTHRLQKIRVIDLGISKHKGETGDAVNSVSLWCSNEALDVFWEKTTYRIF
jgi:hypothetical protein